MTLQDIYYLSASLTSWIWIVVGFLLIWVMLQVRSEIRNVSWTVQDFVLKVESIPANFRIGLFKTVLNLINRKGR